MFKSILLAGFFWATANVMPSMMPLGSASIGVHVPMHPQPLRPAPVLLAASAPRPLPVLPVHLHWIMPSTPISPQPSSERSAPEMLSPDEGEFISRVNAERVERGLPALTVDLMMTRTARAHSREMCSHDYFDHHSPTPGLRTPMDRYLASLHDLGVSQPDYLLVGENIYYCSVSNDIYNVEYSHQALMNSPGHRENILEPRFTKIGVGVYRNAKGEFWVTQMFSRDQAP